MKNTAALGNEYIPLHLALTNFYKVDGIKQQIYFFVVLEPLKTTCQQDCPFLKALGKNPLLLLPASGCGQKSLVFLCHMAFSGSSWLNGSFVSFSLIPLIFYYSNKERSKTIPCTLCLEISSTNILVHPLTPSTRAQSSEDFGTLQMITFSPFEFLLRTHQKHL